MKTMLLLTQSIDATAFVGLVDPVATDPNLSMKRFCSYLNGMTGGNYTSGISTLMTVGSAQATGTVTFTSTGPTDTETMTILGTTFTAVAGTPTNNQFQINASPTTVAANLAAAINASTTALINRNVTATSALGVVTITAIVPGTIGNFFTLTESMSNTAVSGAVFTGGTDATTTYTFDQL